jgi:hypothetical protein
MLMPGTYLQDFKIGTSHFGDVVRNAVSMTMMSRGDEHVEESQATCGV